jgi:hypothetical protein
MFLMNMTINSKFQRIKFDVIIICPMYTWGHVVAQLVEALRYKPEDRGFDPR